MNCKTVIAVTLAALCASGCHHKHNRAIPDSVASVLPLTRPVPVADIGAQPGTAPALTIAPEPPPPPASPTQPAAPPPQVVIVQTPAPAAPAPATVVILPSTPAPVAMQPAPSVANSGAPINMVATDAGVEHFSQVGDIHDAGEHFSQVGDDQGQQPIVP